MYNERQILISTAMYKVPLLSSHWAHELCCKKRPASARIPQDKTNALDVWYFLTEVRFTMFSGSHSGYLSEYSLTGFDTVQDHTLTLQRDVLPPSSRWMLKWFSADQQRKQPNKKLYIYILLSVQPFLHTRHHWAMTCKPVNYKVTVLKLTDLRVLSECLHFVMPTDNDSVPWREEFWVSGVWTQSGSVRLDEGLCNLWKSHWPKTCNWEERCELHTILQLYRHLPEHVQKTNWEKEVTCKECGQWKPWKGEWRQLLDWTTLKR